MAIWISHDRGAQPRLTFGRNVYVGGNTYIGVFMPITIGDKIRCHRRILIHCFGKSQFERRDIPIRDQGFVGTPITIRDEAWLGTHVVVLPGVTIGKGAIIGAGSVVTHDIPDWEIWGGVPARFIKLRPDNDCAS